MAAPNNPNTANPQTSQAISFADTIGEIIGAQGQLVVDSYKNSPPLAGDISKTVAKQVVKGAAVVSFAAAALVFRIPKQNNPPRLVFAGRRHHFGTVSVGPLWQV